MGNTAPEPEAPLASFIVCSTKSRHIGRLDVLDNAETPFVLHRGAYTPETPKPNKFVRIFPVSPLLEASGPLFCGIDHNVPCQAHFLSFPSDSFGSDSQALSYSNYQYALSLSVDPRSRPDTYPPSSARLAPSRHSWLLDAMLVNALGANGLDSHALIAVAGTSHPCESMQLDSCIRFLDLSVVDRMLAEGADVEQEEDLTLSLRPEISPNTAGCFRCLAESPVLGSIYAAGQPSATDEAVYLWDSSTLALKSTFRHQNSPYEPFNALLGPSFDDSSLLRRCLISASTHHCQIWDVRTGSAEQDIPIPNAWSLGLHPDQPIVYCSCPNSGIVEGIDLRNAQRGNELETGRVMSCRPHQGMGGNMWSGNIVRLPSNGEDGPQRFVSVSREERTGLAVWNEHGKVLQTWPVSSFSVNPALIQSNQIDSTSGRVPVLEEGVEDRLEFIEENQERFLDLRLITPNGTEIWTSKALFCALGGQTVDIDIEFDFSGIDSTVFQRLLLGYDCVPSEDLFSYYQALNHLKLCSLADSLMTCRLTALARNPLLLSLAVDAIGREEEEEEEGEGEGSEDEKEGFLLHALGLLRGSAVLASCEDDQTRKMIERMIEEKESLIEEFSFRPNTDTESIHQCFRRVLESLLAKRESDEFYLTVVLRSEREENGAGVSAHLPILLSRSAFFHRILSFPGTERDAAENGEPVVISELSEDSISSLVNFIYTNSFNPSVPSLKSSFELYRHASMYHDIEDDLLEATRQLLEDYSTESDFMFRLAPIASFLRDRSFDSLRTSWVSRGLMTNVDVCNLVLQSEILSKMEKMELRAERMEEMFERRIDRLEQTLERLLPKSESEEEQEN